MGQPMVDPDELDPSGELSARLRATEYEFGHYVANQQIYYQGALAYAPGHQVAVSNVVKFGYAAKGLVDLVEGREHPPEVVATLPEEAAAALAERRLAEARALVAAADAAGAVVPSVGSEVADQPSTVADDVIEGAE